MRLMRSTSSKKTVSSTATSTHPHRRLVVLVRKVKIVYTYTQKAGTSDGEVGGMIGL
jgi:hypothetical protein